MTLDPAYAELLHAGLGWDVALVLVAVSFASSFITAAFGIGGGAVMLAVLASLLPGPAIIPVHGAVQFGSNMGRAAILLRHVHRVILLPFTIGALLGVALGGVLVVQLEAALIQLGVGLFILWSVYAPPPAFLRRSAGLAGAVSSFLTMFFGGTGPFVAAYVRAQQLGRLSHVATHSALMTLQHLLKSLVFGLLGFAFAQYALFIVILIAVGFIGTLIGRMVLTRMEDRSFRLVLNAILTLLALRLVYAGASELWAKGGVGTP
jgi:uncharacterized membrane protein YfcA